MNILHDLFSKKQITTSNSKQLDDTFRTIMSKSSTEDEIKSALQALAENGAPAMISLIKRLRKQKKLLERQRAEGISSNPYEDILKTIREIYIKLGKKGDIRTLEMLIWFYNYQPEDEWDELRMSIGEECGLIKTIGYIKTPESVIFLKNLLDFPRLTDLHYEEIISALGRIASHGAEEVLKGLMNHEISYVREDAAKKLSKIESDELPEREKFLLLWNTKSWSKIKKMGQPAVKYLIETLDQEGTPDEEIKLLCKIGGIQVVPALVDYLRNIDQPLITIISGTIKNDNEKPAQHITAEALARLGDKRGAEVVVDFLMNHPKRLETNQTEYEKEYFSLFGDFTSLIVRLVLYDNRFQLSDMTLNENVRALLELCEIDNPIANNLLHKMKDKIDYTELVGNEPYYPHYEIISTKILRDIASEELLKRGNPPYESAEYIREENWKLV